MAMNKKISELPSAIAAAAANLFAAVQSGVTRQISLQAIADWVVQSAASFAQSGSNDTESVQDVLRRTVFITGYMTAAQRTAIAAGTTTNIDTAISDAHGALPSTGGEIVFPPFAGKYKLTAAPTFTKRVVLRGMGGNAVNAAGTGSTVILKDAAATAAILSLAVDGSAIQDLEVEGENGNTGDGIEIKSGRCRLTNVAVYSMGQDGIRIGDAAGTNCNLWILDNVKSKSNTRHGIYIHDGSGGAPDVNGGTLIHPDVQSNGGAGIKYGNAQVNSQVGGAVQTNTGNGVELTAEAKYNVFDGGDWEGNAKDLVTTSGGIGNIIINATLLAANCTLGEPNNRIEAIDFNNLTTGLKFLATQLASSDANTLDDYEENLFSATAEVIGTGTAGAATYTTRVCTSRKVGDEVKVKMHFIWTAHTGAGNIRITGLPYTSHTSQGRIMVPIGADNLTYGAGTVVAYLENNSTSVDIYLQATGAALSAVALDTAASLYIQFSYIAAS